VYRLLLALEFTVVSDTFSEIATAQAPSANHIAAHIVFHIHGKTNHDVAHVTHAAIHVAIISQLSNNSGFSAACLKSTNLIQTFLIYAFAKALTSCVLGVTSIMLPADSEYILTGIKANSLSRLFHSERL